MADRKHIKADRRTIFKGLAYVIAGAFLLFALFVGLLAGCIGMGRLSNNRGLKNLSQQFNRVSHPVNSKRLERMTDIGILAGNGNHCDFLVAELREYEGQENDIIQAYASQSVPGLTPSFNAGIDLYFPEDEYIDVWPLRQWSEKLNEQDGKTHYIVYILESHISLFMNSWDLRCN